MIVTLAGHVDHGKTSLVRALTGVDTDRLEQEKQRGLTIDLGFAYLDQGRIGFVDVPGHHRFIHNMVAGVASRQYALLVIAADDGPMPQSKEHLDILTLAGVNSGCIALTKADRVDDSRLARAKEEIKQLTAGSFLQDAPVFATSIEDEQSFNTLLAHLTRQAQDISTQTDNQPFRLAVDRKFTVRGAGLVTTGTVHTGTVREQDTLYHFPSNREVRVRGVRAQDQPVAEAGPGDRCALNLTGIDLEDVERGHWLTAEPTPHFVELTINLSVLPDFPRLLRHWTPVHIYHATSHTTGKVALLDRNRIQPGEQALVDLVCDEPLAARMGDRLVLRDFGLDVTLGGGDVVHTQTKVSTRRRGEQRRAELEGFNRTSSAESLASLLQLGPVDLDHFRTVWHLSDKQLSELTNQFALKQVGNEAVSEDTWQQMSSRAVEQLQQHQAANPSATGLRENAFTHIPAAFRQTLLNELAVANKLRNNNGVYSMPDHQAELPAELSASWKRARQDLAVKQAPSCGDLAKQWRAPLHKVEADLKALTKRGLLVHVAKHRFYLPEQLELLLQDVIQLADSKHFSVREFRDATGIGRNVAIEVLEYFDSRGITRRHDNERQLLKRTLR